MGTPGVLQGGCLCPSLLGSRLFGTEDPMSPLCSDSPTSASTGALLLSRAPFPPPARLSAGPSPGMRARRSRPCVCSERPLLACPLSQCAASLSSSALPNTHPTYLCLFFAELLSFAKSTPSSSQGAQEPILSPPPSGLYLGHLSISVLQCFTEHGDCAGDTPRGGRPQPLPTLACSLST